MDGDQLGAGDTLSFDGSAESVSDLIARGGDGADTLTAGGGDDSLHGGDDADSLTGGAGDDTINGALGRDTIFGGLGEDQTAAARTPPPSSSPAWRNRPAPGATGSTCSSR